MFYQQILPSKPPNKYVRCCWVLESDGSDFREKKFKILPDGCPGFVFQENPTAFCQSNNRSLPQCFIYGQTTRYGETKAKASFRNIGVYFRATALKSIFGIDAYEMTDRNTDINDLIKTGISDQLLNANSLSGQIKLLSCHSTDDVFLRSPLPAGRHGLDPLKGKPTCSGLPSQLAG